MLPQVIIIWIVVHNLDSMGRKGPLLISLAGIAASLYILAAVMQIHPHKTCTTLSLIGILLNRIFFSVGIGPLPIVVSAEILPSAIRGRGLAVAMGLSGSIKILAVTAFWPIINAAHPTYLYLTLAIITTVGLVYMAISLGETTGTPLDVVEIEAEAENDKDQNITLNVDE